MDRITTSSEDYLKTIYTLSGRHGRATTKEIAEWLQVRPASVTSMLQKLAQADPSLVKYRKHKGATLTPAGREAALAVIRRHRLLESYLHEKLGYSWDEVHEEAEQLEHVISPQMMKRMAEALGDPPVDPHGQPIPSADLDIDHAPGRPLNTLTVGERAVVLRVRDEDAELLRYLDRHNFHLGVEIMVEMVQTDGQMHIRPAGKKRKVILEPDMTGEIFVDQPAGGAA